MPAIRYGRGHWPGLRADWLMADELFPVCSPALLAGKKKTAAAPGRFGGPLCCFHSSAANDGRLAALADRRRFWPANLSKQPGITFDLVFMTVAGRRSTEIGRGHGQEPPIVEADIAKGRLVVPFKITLPADAGF